MQGKLFVYSSNPIVAGYVQCVSNEPVPGAEWRDGQPRTRYFLQLEGGSRVFLSENGARFAIEKMRNAHINHAAETLQLD